MIVGDGDDVAPPYLTEDLSLRPYSVSEIQHHKKDGGLTIQYNERGEVQAYLMLQSHYAY